MSETPETLLAQLIEALERGDGDYNIRQRSWIVSRLYVVLNWMRIPKKPKETR